MNGLEKEQLSSVCDRFSKKVKIKAIAKKGLPAFTMEIVLYIVSRDQGSKPSES